MYLFIMDVYVSICTDVMVSMGYSREKINDSLTKMKYDDITATYLLLGRKAAEVCYHGNRYSQLLSRALPFAC